MTLIGFSWGAWLGYLFAARFPELVKKLTIVGSGPYDHRYYLDRVKTRENRMSPEQKHTYSTILTLLQNPTGIDKDAAISQLGEICQTIDQYAEAEVDENIQELFPAPQFDVDRSMHFQQALNEFITMRKSGALLNEAEKILCPVVAIHGDYDPHPAKGVKIPLEKTIKDFHFILLDKCGHKPWMERHARSKFFQLLNSEVSASGNQTQS